MGFFILQKQLASQGMFLIKSKLSISAYLFLALYGSTVLQSWSFLKNIKRFLCNQKLVNNCSIPSTQAERKSTNLSNIQADRACGSSAHGQTDSQLNILLLLCSYICSTYYVGYVEYKYRSARKSDLMDTSNHPQADSYVDIQFCF